ncbi:GlsB/YeaQ/YmgE family stress response membrane protein [Streptomyces sp. cg28]|uniref:GlsB/YeaQ/YmgE family stress response membrane protein n=1 Tax=unclassified Streptomyces TaxID=2593676 RepID=UPI003332B168
MSVLNALLCLPVGVVMATLGRLINTGRPRISVLWTMGAAVLAALIGTIGALLFAPACTPGVTWTTLLLQTVPAAAAVACTETIEPCTFAASPGGDSPTS